MSVFLPATSGVHGCISSTAEGIAVTSDGRIWVADTGNHRIQVFDSTGAFLGKVGSFGGGNEQFKSPKQLAVDSLDRIWVADSGNGRLVTVQEDTGQITPVITSRTNTSATIGAGNSGSVTASCAAGEVVVGGGCTNTGSGSDSINTYENYADSNTSWRCSIRNGSGSGQTVTAQARCLTTPLG